MNYCAVCDHWYKRGKFYLHRMTAAHMAEAHHRREMVRWYRANGA